MMDINTKAIRINTSMPENMYLYCKKHGIRLSHVMKVGFAWIDSKAEEYATMSNNIKSLQEKLTEVTQERDVLRERLNRIKYAQANPLRDRDGSVVVAHPPIQEELGTSDEPGGE